jgi:hypothetical protein
MLFEKYCNIFKKRLKKLTFANYFGEFWKILKGKNKGTLSEGRKNKKMQLSFSKKNRRIFATIVTMLFLLSSIAAMPVNAQQMQNSNTAGGALPAGVTPDVVMEGKIFLSFSPNPIGVGQELLVNVWSIPAPGANRAHTGYTVTFTKPDGTKDVVGPFNSFVADGTNWFTYIPKQAGNYSVQFTYPGDYYPAGRYVNGVLNNSAPAGASFMDQRDYPSTWYKPAQTPVQTLIVQENPVMSWYSPLPTDYWTRPISPENREWANIGGNYPYAYYNSMCRDNGPFITGPNTSHIVWKQQEAVAGMIGGEAGTYSIAAQPGTPSVIYLGRCYQTLTIPVNGVPTSCAVCYDLRTGKQYYAIPVAQGGVTPTAISYISPTAVAGIGSTASGSFTVDLLTLSGGSGGFGAPAPLRLYKIDPYTGAVTLNLTLTGLASGTIYNNGLVISTQTINATLGQYRLINWSTAGSSTNFATRMFSNVSWPSNMAPGGQGLSCDFNVGVAVGTVAGIYGAASGGAAVTGGDFGLASGAFGTRIVGISIITGQVLYNFTTTDTSFNPGSNSFADGKILIPMDMGILNCYDLLTGKLLWQSHDFDYPWGAFGGYNAEGAYGLYYWQTYDGLVAFNVSTGQRAWKYQYQATPFEVPYTMTNGTSEYSFYGAAQVADGKIYVYNTEHSQSYPITRGWKLHCVDAYTGKGLWNITGSMQPGAISDGYLTAGNAYDGYMYVFGKGQSATTVSAPQTQITTGTNAIISGTVLDQSPGQLGTPCVSADSMSGMMEYIHMQHQMPADVTGVPVSIDATDPNGNYVHIGDAVSDASGTYSYVWSPTMAGNYKITATFMGDDSYGSSWGETHATVVNAEVAPSTSPSPISFDSVNSNITNTVIAGVVAIIAVIVIFGLLILRKK